MVVLLIVTLFPLSRVHYEPHCFCRKKYGTLTIWRTAIVLAIFVGYRKRLYKNEVEGLLMKRWGCWGRANFWRKLSTKKINRTSRNTTAMECRTNCFWSKASVKNKNTLLELVPTKSLRELLTRQLICGGWFIWKSGRSVVAEAAQRIGMKDLFLACWFSQFMSFQRRYSLSCWYW